MAEQQTTVTGGEGQDTLAGEGKSESEIQQQLTQANTRAAEATLYAKMSADPEIGEILRARAAGKKVKIVPADAQQSQSVADEIAPEPEKEPDLTTMDTKQVLAYYMRKNAQMTEKMIDKKLAPVLQSVEETRQVSANQLRDRAQSEVNTVRTKYPDFDQHLPAITRLNASNPGLNPQQLYVLAKAEAGEPVVDGKQLSSERPSTTGARPSAPTTKKGNKSNVPPAGNSMLALRDVIRNAAASRLTDGSLGNAGDGDDE